MVIKIYRCIIFIIVYILLPSDHCIVAFKKSYLSHRLSNAKPFGRDTKTIHQILWNRYTVPSVHSWGISWTRSTNFCSTDKKRSRKGYYFQRDVSNGLLRNRLESTKCGNYKIAKGHYDISDEASYLKENSKPIVVKTLVRTALVKKYNQSASGPMCMNTDFNIWEEHHHFVTVCQSTNMDSEKHLHNIICKKIDHS